MRTQMSLTAGVVDPVQVLGQQPTTADADVPPTTRPRPRPLPTHAPAHTPRALAARPRIDHAAARVLVGCAVRPDTSLVAARAARLMRHGRVDTAWYGHAYFGAFLDLAINITLTWGLSRTHTQPLVSPLCSRVSPLCSAPSAH